MKSKFALAGLLMLGACTTLPAVSNVSPEERMQLACKAIPIVVNDLAGYRARGELSESTNTFIESLEGPVTALCKPGVTDYLAAATVLQGYLDTLVNIQRDIE